MSYEVLQLALFTNDIEQVKPIEKIVSPLGWQLMAAVTQKQPIQWILEKKVELILLDLDMPNGIHLISSLIRCQPSVPILVITSEESRDKVEDAMAAGAKDFINYPVNAKQLMASLHRAIGERSTTVSNIIPDFDDIPADMPKVRNGNRVTDPIQTRAPMPMEKKVAPSREEHSWEEHAISAQDAAEHNLAGSELFDHVEVARPLKSAQSINAPKNEPPQVQTPSRTQIATPAVAIRGQGQTNHRAPSVPPPQEPMVQPTQARANVPQTAHRNIRVESPQTMHIQSNYGVAEYGMTTMVPSIQGKTTAIVSLRGGIGRSTIAANLAVAIAQKKAGGVTLVEAHHGLSNLSLMLHLHPQRTLATIENEHTIDYDIVRGYLQQHTSGVNVLSAPTEIDDMVELAPDTWSHLLSITTGLAQHTIIDTAAAADSALTEVLMKANEILVVTDPDIASLRSASSLYQNIYTEPSISGQMHLIINRVGVNGGLDEKAIQKQLGQQAIASLPYDRSLTTYAMNRGIPFIQSHPRALLSKRIQALAAKIFESSAGAGQQAVAHEPAAKSSFMSFLGR